VLHQPVGAHLSRALAPLIALIDPGCRRSQEVAERGEQTFIIPLLYIFYIVQPDCSEKTST
jgi:hypothetical protein